MEQVAGPEHRKLSCACSGRHNPLEIGPHDDSGGSVAPGQKLQSESFWYSHGRRSPGRGISPVPKELQMGERIGRASPFEILISQPWG